MNWKKSLYATLAAAFVAAPVYAHTGPIAEGLSSGLLHPFLGLDHLLALLTVGVLAVRPSESMRWFLPLTFAGVMALGALVGMMNPGPSNVEFAVAGSVVLLGALLIWGRQFNSIMLVFLVALSALMHGQVHGAEASGAWFSYLGGMTVSTLFLHLCGVFLGTLLVRRSETSLRLYGAATLSLGLALCVGLV
ncbi:MAG: HupE/UreJ family protein [bacterium]|nr:HupE/UreJ family protein [bacterium]